MKSLFSGCSSSDNKSHVTQLTSILILPQTPCVSIYVSSQQRHTSSSAVASSRLRSSTRARSFFTSISNCSQRRLLCSSSVSRSACAFFTFWCRCRRSPSSWWREETDVGVPKLEKTILLCYFNSGHLTLLHILGLYKHTTKLGLYMHTTKEQYNIIILLMMVQTSVL